MCAANAIERPAFPTRTSEQDFLNQQQLQTARASLWRHSNPLVTLDDASAWLEEIGLCLLLPRPAQLPAPAPSFVEAVIGAPSAAPLPGAIAQATELATRLIAGGRAIPLNLLGTYSEQPDFLVTPDVLPWVAAIRGERQWKTAPGGRTSPIVLRTWAALDQNGALTAIEIREILGRELTEAAVLRALIELWTTLRAAPAYAQGEPTRWSLLKSGYARQLTTAANTALPTALSALASIYLRSAIAATAEEAETFLSPLTARSRIREMLHGMTAGRQFGTLSLASQTLLFVEGSLPETPAEPEAEAAPVSETRQPVALREPRPPRPPFRDKPAPRREFREKRPPFGEKTERRAFSGKRPPFRDQRGSFQKPRPDQPRDRQFPPRRDDRGPSQFRPRREDRPAAGFPPRRNDRPPFQRRDDAGERPRRDDRGPSQFRPRQDRPAGKFPRRDDRPAAGFQQRRETRPWQKDRPQAGAKSGDRDNARPRFEPRNPPSRFAPPRRKPFGGKPGFSGAPDRGPRPGGRPSEARGPAENRPRRDAARPESRRPFAPGKFRSGPPQKPRGDRPPSRFGKSPGPFKPRFAKGPAEDKPRFGKSPGKPRSGDAKGKPSFGKGPGGPGKGKPGFAPRGGKPRFGAGRPFTKSPRKNFTPSAAPRSRKPRKNRNQEEGSE